MLASIYLLGLVPRIQFGDLDMSSGGLPHSFSNMSLSGALLSESSIMRMSGNSIGANGPNSFRANGNNGDGTSRSYKAGMVSQMTSHRSYQDASLQSVSGEEHNAPFSHALMAPHALQNFDRAIGSHRNAHDPNFPDEPSTGGNTRMLTWRAAEDACTHFTVSTTAANGRMMPTTQPSSAYLAAQERVFRKSSFHGPSSSRGACTDSSIPEVPVQFKQYLGLGVGLEDSTVSTLLQTYHIIVAILLQRAVSTSSDPNNSAVANSPTPGPGAPLHCAPAWLDSAVCSSCNEFPSPFRGAPVDCSTNILFNVREYLEILPSSSAESHNHNMSMFGSYATATASTLNVSPESSLDLLGPAKAVVGADVAHTDKIHENIMLLGLHRGDAARRLCKMISGAYLKHSCLVQHMLEKSSIGVRLAEKIGEGGFGTVFKVTCNCCSSVGAYMQYSNCYGCHRRTHLFKNLSPDLSSRNITSCCCWKANNHTAYSQSTTKTSPAYAIKRVPRERSMHDPSRLFDLYQEISALEILRDRRTIGVCGIEDYGVVGSEYWLVMELGVQNLEEWRNYLTAGSPRHDASVASPAESTSRALTMQQVASCLLLYIDALYILESVHAADIAHFDLKSSNFVLRPANRESFTAATLSLSEMCQFHQSGLPSGAIFLADFGEAIPHISSAQGSALVRTRCRGTLHTQSPEMLCISATGASSAPPHTCPSSSNSTVNIGMPSGGNCLTAPRAPTPTPTPVPAPVAATRSSKNPRKVLPLPDCRSDLWSMGCLLVELLAGCPLFQDKPWPELYITLCMETFTSLESLIPAVLTPALARIPLAVQSAIKQLILAVLQQLPSDRPTTKSLIVQAGAVLQSHFREYLEVHAEVGPRLSNNSFDSKKETVPEISLSGVHAQVVTLTSVDVATPPIPCGSDVHFRFIRCTPRLTNVFSAGNVNSQLNDSVTAGAAQPICRIDGDILLASLGQCAHAMAMQETGRSPNQQVITLRVRSQTLQQDGLSARLPVADNLVFDLLVNPAAQMSHLLSEVTRAVQRVHTARTEAGKSAVAAGQITVAVVVEVEPQLPVPLASEDAPALWETDKLAVSVAVAAASLLNRSTPSSGGDNSNAGAECALQKVINLWRSLPRLQSYCDQEVVRRLICASAVSR